MPGRYTIELAKRIEKKYNGYQIFYDHGNSENANVRHIKLSLDKDLNNGTVISQVDIAICRDSAIIALIEIEESGTLSPKKIISDIMTMVMAENVFIIDNNNKNVKYQINKETKYIVYGLHNPLGRTEQKIKFISTKLIEL